MNSTLRTAGWGMLGFGLAYFVTFAVNSLINTLIAYSEHPLAADMSADFGGGILFLMTWSTAGIALVIAAQALPAIVWPDGGLASRIAASFWVIAAAGWISSGVGGFVQRTPLLNGNIAAEGADAASEGAVIEGLFILVHFGAVLFALALVPAIVMVCVTAARRRRLSTATIVLLWIGGLAPLVGFLATGFQFGLLAPMIAFAIVGILLLRRAKRARTAEVAVEPTEVAAAAA